MQLIPIYKKKYYIFTMHKILHKYIFTADLIKLRIKHNFQPDGNLLSYCMNKGIKLYKTNPNLNYNKQAINMYILIMNNI